jgi:hypothetical protein
VNAMNYKDITCPGSANDPYKFRGIIRKNISFRQNPKCNQLARLHSPLHSIPYDECLSGASYESSQAFARDRASYASSKLRAKQDFQYMDENNFAHLAYQPTIQLSTRNI